MVNSEIQNWLNGDRNFNKGLLLFQFHGKTIYPANMVMAEWKLMSGKEDAMKGKLLNYLKEIYNASKKDLPNQNMNVMAGEKKVRLPSSDKNKIVRTGKITLQSFDNSSDKKEILKNNLSEQEEKVSQKTAHRENATVNIKLSDNSVMKIHPDLVEKVNGMEMHLGSTLKIGISQKEFLKMLYSGERLDLVLCKLNLQMKSGGEREEFRNVICTVSREWVDHLSDDIKAYPVSTQKQINQLKAEWLPWWAEKCDLHSKLKVTNDKKQRYEYAERIVYLQKCLVQVWDAVNFIKKFGRPPANFVLPTLKPVEVQVSNNDAAMVKEHENLIANISKMRKAVKTLSGTKLEKKQAALAKSIERRDFIREKLGYPKLKE